MGVEVERVTPIDEMIEYALEELMAGGEDGRRRGGLVRHMCLKFPPSEPALSLVFALTSAGAMIEDNLVRDGESGGDVAPPLAYKLAAVLAGDIYAVESMGGHQPARTRDLLHFWRRVDGYFLEL